MFNFCLRQDANDSEAFRITSFAIIENSTRKVSKLATAIWQPSLPPSDYRKNEDQYVVLERPYRNFLPMSFALLDEPLEAIRVSTTNSFVISGLKAICFCFISGRTVCWGDPKPVDAMYPGDHPTDLTFFLDGFGGEEINKIEISTSDWPNVKISGFKVYIAHNSLP